MTQHKITTRNEDGATHSVYFDVSQDDLTLGLSDARARILQPLRAIFAARWPAEMSRYEKAEAGTIRAMGWRRDDADKAGNSC